MKNSIFIFALSIVLIVVIFGVISVVKTGNLSGVDIEPREASLGLAPDFALLDISGNEKRLSDFKGKVIMLDFWASWCPPCKAEIPHFVELYDEYKDGGLEIIGITSEQNTERLRSFIEANDIAYTILLDDTDVSSLYGGIVSIPTTFIIDRDGNIAKRYIGYREKKVFEDDIKELL